ncbi:MAG: cell division protein FtsK [Alphaproteobacteria bacterium]|nr:cell division protein FtsK [Alphaproteobacteria bacterium]
MASTTSRSGNLPFLPEAMARVLRRRIEQCLGWMLILLSFSLLAALVTYDPSDPSLNSAGGRVLRNIMGRPGAHVADVVVQSLGGAGFMLAIVLLAWGWRFVVHRSVTLVWLRLTLLPFGLLFTASALSVLAPPPFWPVPAGLGGAAGSLVLGKLFALTPLIGQGIGATTLAVASAALAMACLIPACGLSLIDWVWAARGSWRLAAVTGRGVAIAGGVGTRLGMRFGGVALGAGMKLAREIGTGGGERVEPRLRDPDAADRVAPAAMKPELEAPTLDAAPEPAPVLHAERRGESRIEARADEKSSETKRKKSRQQSLDLVPAGGYKLPPQDLLAKPNVAAKVALDKDALEQNARMLESVLQDFGVRGQIVKVRPGPVVTLYELEPAPGTKSSRVIGLSDDIARSMSAISVRVAVIPGRNVIGIELPNQHRETVYLRELLADDSYERGGGKLALILGKDIGGAPIVTDLARMPHLLIAGTTGSGKSVAINTMILSLLYRLPPNRCRFIMIDPKMLELSVYDGIPHLLSPVVTDPKKAVVALKWTVREMENRYRGMSKLGVRNIEGYNQRIAEAVKNGETLKRRVQTGFDAETGKPVFEDEPLDLTPLPYIVVVVDEMADLMLVAGKDIEAAIQRLAQMARAAGIHLLMATQRPSVDVITGTIKANFPTRISFQVTSKIDSRTILGEQGAETLLGQGDMLYMAGGGRITRVHGPFVSDREVEEVVKFLKDQGEPEYLDEVTEDDDAGGFGAEAMGGEGSEGGSGDQLFDQAVALVARERKCSTSFIQRHLQIGYNRAARIVERMEADGMVSQPNHVGKREVLLRKADEA